MSLKKIPFDKILHFLFGVGMTLVLSWFTTPEKAVIITICMGGLKEIYDGISENGTPELWDLIATIAGGAVAYAGIKALA